MVFEPQAHISHWVRLGFGSDHIRARHESGEVVRRLYARVHADERLWTILESTGLATFAMSDMAMRESTRSTAVVRSLVEFFWDSTNTFHFPWGEMTITPADFAVISGLPITPLRVEIDDDLRVSHPMVERMLGPITADCRRESMSSSKISKKTVRTALLESAFEMDGTTPEQRVRIFLLVLISSTFTEERSSRAMLRLLPSVRELDRVSLFDWSGLGFVDLMLGLRHASRQVRGEAIPIIYGLWYVVEVSPFLCEALFP